MRTREAGVSAPSPLTPNVLVGISYRHSAYRAIASCMDGLATRGRPSMPPKRVLVKVSAAAADAQKRTPTRQKPTHFLERAPRASDTWREVPGKSN